MLTKSILRIRSIYFFDDLAVYMDCVKETTKKAFMERMFLKALINGKKQYGK